MFRKQDVSAEKVAQCEARAQKIVETFIDPVEDEISFLRQLRWINRDHYQYITEERAIEKMCGYPLCSQKLTNIPIKKYQICTLKNKVYDLTERKHFCSNLCYKANCYLKQQLFITPLWIRDEEEEPEFVLLKNSTELMGDEVRFEMEKIDISETNVDSKCRTEASKSSSRPNNRMLGDDRVCVRNKRNDVNEKVGSEVSFETSTTAASIDSRDKSSSVDKTNEFRSSLSSSDRQIGIDPIVDTIGPSNEHTINVSEGIVYAPKDNLSSDEGIAFRSENNDSRSSSSDHAANSTLISESVSDSAKNKNKAAKIFKNSLSKRTSTLNNVRRVINHSNFVLRVEKSLREWFTVETVSFVMGAETVKRSLLEKGKIFEQKKSSENDSFLYERYVAICKKLKLLELEEEKQLLEKAEKEYEKPTKTLPDYETLKNETKDLEIKVRAFYRGDKKVTFDENRNDEADDEERPVVLPPLHRYAQISIRRNIVLDKLKITLPDVVTMLELPTIDITERIKQLARTCRFAAHNITFKPLEWNLICLILIKLLSLQDVSIRNRLLEKAHYVNAILMSYQLENNYLDLVCTWLTDLDEILKNEEDAAIS